MPYSLPDLPAWEPPETGMATIELKLSLITPMFGGGYEVREVDEDEGNPIRAAAIRGHLRFWWRATAGARFVEPRELFEAEEALWGSADKVGKVVTLTQIVDPGKSKKHGEIAPKPKPQSGPKEGFFLFPFQPQVKEKTPEATGRENLKFKLIIRYAGEYKQEIENTIKAWITFGGVGARTRRGCGALKVENDVDKWLPPSEPEKRRRWLCALLKAKSENTAHFSHLKGSSLVMGSGSKDAVEQWRRLGCFWAKFRKGHLGGIQYSPTGAGSWGDYKKLIQFKENSPKSIELVKPFFGLPIIYQNLPGAKFYGEVKPSCSGRMSSPAILKPVALADGSFCPMVAILVTPPLKRIYINDNDREVEVKYPRSDKVLKELDAATPIDTVIKAAEKEFDTKAIRIEVLP